MSQTGEKSTISDEVNTMQVFFPKRKATSVVSMVTKGDRSFKNPLFFSSPIYFAQTPSPVPSPQPPRTPLGRQVPMSRASSFSLPFQLPGTPLSFPRPAQLSRACALRLLPSHCCCVMAERKSRPQRGWGTLRQGELVAAFYSYSPNTSLISRCW